MSPEREGKKGLGPKSLSKKMSEERCGGQKVQV
jgi:hypothetical protein